MSKDDPYHQKHKVRRYLICVKFDGKAIGNMVIEEAPDVWLDNQRKETTPGDRHPYIVMVHELEPRVEILEPRGPGLP